jgi:hypothetical protein
MAPKRHEYAGPDAGPEKSAGYHGPYHQGHPVGQKAREDSPATGHLHNPSWGADQKPGHDHSGAPSVKPDNCYPASDRDGRPAADLNGGKPVCDYSKR